MLDPYASENPSANGGEAVVGRRDEVREISFRGVGVTGNSMQWSRRIAAMRRASDERRADLAPAERPKTSLDRRLFVAGAGALALSGCAVSERGTANTTEPTAVAGGPIPAYYLAMYGPVTDEPYPVPAVDLRKVDPRYWRREVDNPTGERAGVVVVDIPSYYLYWTMPRGRAIRYGVGLGREGFAWSGDATIPFKREWPTWTPPDEMIDRDPKLEKYREGMPPGLANPLGARALYLYSDGVDTLYRLHGTQEAFSIGRAVSSGCVRLLNQDIIDLYNRVPNGTKVIVRGANAPISVG